MTTDPSLTLVADALVEAHDNRGAPWCPECRGPERAAEEAAEIALAALVEAGWRAPGDEDEAAPLDAGPVSPETLVLMHGTTRSGLPFNVEVDLNTTEADRG